MTNLLDLPREILVSVCDIFRLAAEPSLDPDAGEWLVGRQSLAATCEVFRAIVQPGLHQDIDGTGTARYLQKMQDWIKTPGSRFRASWVRTLSIGIAERPLLERPVVDIDAIKGLSMLSGLRHLTIDDLCIKTLPFGQQLVSSLNALNLDQLDVIKFPCYAPYLSNLAFVRCILAEIRGANVQSLLVELECDDHFVTTIIEEHEQSLEIPIATANYESIRLCGAPRAMVKYLANTRMPKLHTLAMEAWEVGPISFRPTTMRRLEHLKISAISQRASDDLFNSVFSSLSLVSFSLLPIMASYERSLVIQLPHSLPQSLRILSWACADPNGVRTLCAQLRNDTTRLPNLRHLEIRFPALAVIDDDLNEFRDDRIFAQRDLEYWEGGIFAARDLEDVANIRGINLKPANFAMVYEKELNNRKQRNSELLAEEAGVANAPSDLHSDSDAEDEDDESDSEDNPEDSADDNSEDEPEDYSADE